LGVTAGEIIEEIKRLDPKEQLDVIRFAYQLDAERKLSGAELSSLAARMAETDDAVEAVRIREAIVRGFYGRKHLTAAFDFRCGWGGRPGKVPGKVDSLSRLASVNADQVFLNAPWTLRQSATLVPYCSLS
jgi:hypothetical protein